MRSMTGFGEARGETGRYRLTVTLRGVNHRFLDLALRLRDDLREAEPALREVLSTRLERGRVEVAVEAAPVAGRSVTVGVDRAAVEALHRLAGDLAARGDVHGGLSFADLLRVPELVRFEARDPTWGADERELLLRVAETAADRLVAARELEGGALRAALADRLAALTRLVGALRERAAGAPAALAETLRRRVAELLASAPVDEARLAQEVALLAERTDVREELDRLGSHLDHFGALLDTSGSLGKRLEFLVQELGRELNTVGSKCRDAETTRLVVDAKVLCEQLREQVQNVE